MTTAASGYITEEINCCVYCLPSMLGSQERDFTIVTRLAQFLCACVLKFASECIKKIARPKSDGAARVARSALEAAGEDFGRSLQYCWCSLAGAGCF